MKRMMSRSGTRFSAARAAGLALLVLSLVFCWSMPSYAASSDTAQLKAAKQEYREAKKAYQAKGYEFIAANVSASGSLEALEQKMKADSTVSKYVGSGLEKGVKNALSSGNIERSIELVRELNELRSRSDNPQGAAGTVKVSYDLMMWSAASGYVSEDTYNHTLFMALMYQAGTEAECLAWGYGDPFDGWYTKEKKIYDANPSNADFNDVGHYLILTSPEYSAVGLTYNDNATAAMNFKSYDAGSITVDAFEQAFRAYTADAKAAQDAAKAKYDKVYKAYKARRHVDQVKQKKPRVSKRAITVRWNKVRSASGYQVQCAYDSMFWSPVKKITVRGGRTVSKKIRGLYSRQKYFVRVRAYRVVDGKKYYGKWSAVKSARAK